LARRAFNRLAVRLEATVEQNGQPISGIVEDLSLGGAHIRCFLSDIAPGEIVSVTALGQTKRCRIITIAEHHLRLRFMVQLSRGPLFDLLALQPIFLKRNRFWDEPIEQRHSA